MTVEDIDCRSILLDEKITQKHLWVQNHCILSSIK